MKPYRICYHDPGGDFRTRLYPRKSKNRALDQLRQTGYKVPRTPPKSPQR